MRYPPESLEAFVQAAESGSFSAAARALRKSQSTISTAIANLESDLGFLLFHRRGRASALTSEGRRALEQVKEILKAGARLDELAVRLSGEVEPCLTLAISDFWQANYHEQLLREFAERYPDIEFECLIAEDEDVIELLQQQRANLGVIRVQPAYPTDVVTARLQVEAQMAIYLHHSHRLCHQSQVTEADLRSVRQLRLNTYTEKLSLPVIHASWFAPSYLILLEMAEQGFGWSILPCWLVKQFGHQKLTELPVRGWPQKIQVDAVWSRLYGAGRALDSRSAGCSET